MISIIKTGNPELDRLIMQLVENANKISGSTIDRMITPRDLMSAGLINYVGGKIIPASDAEMASPARPENVNGIGTYESAILTWSASDFPASTITAIHRSLSNDFATSALISVDLGNQFTDVTVQEDVIYFYWIQFIRVDGRKGPLSGTDGVEIYVPLSAAALIANLGGAITVNELSQSLSSDINNLKTESNQRTADINILIGAELDAALALTKSGSNERDIQALSAGGEANMTVIQSWIDQEAQVRASEDSGLALLITQLQSAVGDNTSTISSVQTAYADGDNALALSINNLESVVGNNNATIQQTLTTKASKTDAPYAMWEVKSTVNELTAGIGLFNNGVKTSLGINAQEFYVFDPTTSNSSTPFIIENGEVYIDSAKIKEASIDKAKIGSVSFNSIQDGTGASITVGGKLKADYIDADNLTVNESAKFTGDVESTGKVGGLPAWALFQNGRAIFRNQIVSVGGNQVLAEDGTTKADKTVFSEQVLSAFIDSTLINLDTAPRTFSQYLIVAKIYLPGYLGSHPPKSTIVNPYNKFIRMFGYLDWYAYDSNYVGVNYRPNFYFRAVFQDGTTTGWSVTVEGRTASMVSDTGTTRRYKFNDDIQLFGTNGLYETLTDISLIQYIECGIGFNYHTNASQTLSYRMAKVVITAEN